MILFIQMLRIGSTHEWKAGDWVDRDGNLGMLGGAGR